MNEEIENIDIDQLLEELDKALHSCPGAGESQIETTDEDL